MAGTNAKQPVILGGPAIILVEPQLGENIGAAARAMLNCGLSALRLVRPRDGWPNRAAWPMAAGADLVLEGAAVFPGVEEAVADLQRVYATTVRPRDMVKPVVTPRVAAGEMRAVMAAGGACGVLFGPERSGLDNDAIALADTVVTAPLNPAFGSLNLAQAVLLVGYEWLQADDARTARWSAELPADKERLIALFRHLEQELDAAGFFVVPEKRPGMIRSIRNMLERAHLTVQEVRTLHGIVTALSGRRLGGKPRGRDSE